MTADPDYSYPEMVDFYRRNIEEHGVDDVRALGYFDRNRQHLRFAAMKDQLNFHHILSILDVGCGTGDLYEYLKDYHTFSEYRGVDVVDEFIKAAKGRHLHGAQWEAKDFLTAPPGDIKPAYYVLSCGMLSWQPAHIAIEMMHKLWTLTEGVLVFNCVKDQPLDFMQVSYYFQQWGIKWWEYHHTYLPDDFMIVAHRENPYE